MIITIASGKGGTGKTTVAVNLAYTLAHQGKTVRLLDCDVEEPNDHLFVRPDFQTETDVTVMKPVWNADPCTACGKCVEACQYNAMALVKGKILIFQELCHACGVCSHVCPVDALTETPSPIGKVRTATGPQPFFFADGVLNLGEALAPNIVRGVKQHLTDDPDTIQIIDASPGTACPVVEAVEGADAALLVTEPTPFGLHDLKLALALTLKVGIPTGIVVNRSDGKDAIIQEYADAVGIPVVGRIPFRREYAETYSGGGILVEAYPDLEKSFLELMENLSAVRTAPVPEEPEFLIPDGTPPDFETGTAEQTREWTVISGKGGTGKTSVAGSFAYLGKNQVLADNDVDAADLHLLLAPVIREVHPFTGGKRAIIDADACIGCGKCAEVCHFDAIRMDGPANDLIGKTYRVEPLLCEGCGLCPLVCPVEAIREDKTVNGKWFVSGTDQGPMVHARLGIAEENSGKLVTQVRERASALARELKRGHILADGPPGTGCPVIASVSGTDLVIIVTEPTVSGVHDMERVLKLTAHFGVPAVVIINKADLNRDQAWRIREMAEAAGSRVIGEIPFDRSVHLALLEGKTVVEYGEGEAQAEIRRIWEKLNEYSV